MAPKRKNQKRRNKYMTNIAAPAIVWPARIDFTITDSSTTSIVSAPSISNASDPRLTSVNLQFSSNSPTAPLVMSFQLFSSSAVAQVETAPLQATVGQPVSLNLRMPRYIDRATSPRFVAKRISGTGIVTGYANFSYRGSGNTSSSL